MSKEEQKRQDGARTKASTAGTAAQEGKIGGEWKFAKNPEFIKNRLEIWNNLFEAQKKVYEEFPKRPIKITLPDGTVKEGMSFETSPYDIAKGISKQMADKIIVAKIKYSTRVATLDDGLLNPEAEEGVTAADQWYFWDVNRVLEGDCQIKLIKFEDDEGKETFWHSSAHILGQTLENEYGVHLCHGPPTDSGFFYDSYSGSDIFHEKDYPSIEKAAKKIVESKQTFERLVLTKEEALHLFGQNPFKVSLISGKIPDGGRVTAYRCGSLIDLCTGPHIPSTKIIKAFKIMKNSSAYWLGKADHDSLQRVYGITFPSKKEMDEYVHLIEEAAKRDHRTIGRQQGLFDHHEWSPGCGFMYPKGCFIYNKLIEMVREQYRVRGFQEVLSPNIFNLKLWKTSGHYKNYKDNIFILKSDNQGCGVKPMNCPGHCLMFANELRTYRELPLRYADFGVLHRNEIHGALSGLTRVRRFQQDDAHQFCTEDQIKDEVLNNLDMLDYIYGIFGFNFELELSTRPASRLGSDDLWDKAEGALAAALNEFGRPWKENPGDGAFYGPKIDIKVFDALKRAHQCGTVQLDFQLPIRFNLQFKTDAACDKEVGEKKELGRQLFEADEYDKEPYEWKEQPLKPGYARPVIVHRAILGSVERFMAILIEHLGGKWPFFLSPRQVMVCPISVKSQEYCDSVYLYLHRLGYQVEVDHSALTLNKKIRTHQLAQWNFILVAGEEEAKAGTVDIRSRDNKRIGKMRIDTLHEYFQSLMPPQALAAERLYSKAWNPEDYEVEGCASGEIHGEKEKCKVFVSEANNALAQLTQVVADISGADVEIFVSSDKSKSISGRFPYMETSNGTIISESEAIVKHVARMNHSSGLLGKNPFEHAKIDEWIAWAQTAWLPKMHPANFAIFGYGRPDMSKFSESVKAMKELARQLDHYLKDKKWINHDNFSLADIYLGVYMMSSFQLVFDAGFRKAVPHLSAWFERFSCEPAVVRRFGHIRACAKALKPAAGGPPAAKPAPKKEEAKPAAADDDLDLFGDDNEEDAAAAKAVAEKAKAGKKPKKVVIAQSLVLFEVKPLDSETDIDAMAKAILEIKMDGLYWKTEYKKIPLVFGLFKIVIGMTVEDDKVSVDDVQEKIEALEDMVQSVEIAAFNKI